MAKKKLIWIMGATASGKSTLRRLLTELTQTEERVYHDEDGMSYTTYGRTAVLGKCNPDGVCDGLDIVFNKIRKEGCLRSAETCIRDYEITMMEGAMATAQWILPLCEYCLKYDCKFYVIHLDLRYWENYKRLVNRVIERGGTEKDIKDSMLESVRGKSVQMKNLYTKCENTGFIKCLKIDTEDMSQEEKLMKTINFLKLKI